MNGELPGKPAATGEALAGAVATTVGRGAPGKGGVVGVPGVVLAGGGFSCGSVFLRLVTRPAYSDGAMVSTSSSSQRRKLIARRTWSYELTTA